VEYRVRLSGGGRRTVTAHGLADAEAQVEKEWNELWREARIAIREVARREGGALTAIFEVVYGLSAEVVVTAGNDDDARRKAFRHARARVQGTPFGRAEWERAVPTPLD
jgi:hypothetical protein